MAKRYTKKNKSKRVLRKGRKTRKFKYGGGPTNQEIVNTEARKNRYINYFKDLIIQITNRKNINQAVKSIISNFESNKNIINTLIPISETGKPIDIRTSKYLPVDFVSPITVIFDNLTDVITDDQLLALLIAYFKEGGNFNNLSSISKISPFENEVNKRRINNVKMLLNKSNKFIIEDGLSEETKKKLAELIPNEQQIVTQPQPQPQIPLPKLNFSYPLPTDNAAGYDRSVAPEFWKPIFDNGEELMSLRESFMGIYELDKYTSDASKEFIICNLLEKLFPGYYTKTVLSYGETVKTLVTVNVLNCLITLLYGLITYRLYDYKEDYLILFKGGRALQLSLNDIPKLTKYFSEDTDVQIIPNKFQGGVYNLEKMKNLSSHIAYLIKWFIPPEVNIVITLPTELENSSKEITKVLYNDNKLYKALSDIGFGDTKEEIKKYFENPMYFPFYLDDFETMTLFIVPTLDDIMDEKLYYYSKYSNARNKLQKGEKITEKGYENLTIDECNFYMYKFIRAIKQLINSMLKRDNIKINKTGDETSTELIFPDTITDFHKKYSRKEQDEIYKILNDKSRDLMRIIIKKFDDYSDEEKERITQELYP
jgi:hypothetical protein